MLGILRRALMGFAVLKRLAFEPMRHIAARMRVVDERKWLREPPRAVRRAQAAHILRTMISRSANPLT
jgi:hypothetical protein